MVAIEGVEPRGVVERIPVGHVGTIADVSGAVIYLASEAGAMVNGAVLPVDGGVETMLATPCPSYVTTC